VPALRLALDKACAKTVPESSLVTSTYYDSPDLKLWQQSLSLHVQEQNGRRVQVVKSIGSAAARGMVDGEWRDPIAADRPDLAAPETGTRLGVVVGDALRPLFKTQIRRALFKVDPDPSVEIAAALEEGELSAADGDAAEPVCELQLDLNRGDPAFLYNMALRLLDAAPLRIATQSVPERGYRLTGAEREAVTAKPLALKPFMTAETVLQSVGRECLGHLLGNEPAAIAGDAEAFHQMRVALRRLRSALAAVRSMLPIEQYRWLQEELKWLAGNLGPARDWDVFIADLLAPVQSALLEDAHLGQLANAAKRHRRAAYNVAKEAIESRRYAASMLKLARWFETRGWREQQASEHSAPLFAPIAEVAPLLIERPWRQARKRSKRFAKLSQDERHQARIAVKNLRYMTEFLGGLFEADEVDALMVRLKRLQEELGYLNDVRTGRRLIKQIARPADDHSSEVGQCAGMVIGWHIRGLTNSEANLGRNVRRFRKAKPFWRPARGPVAIDIVNGATKSAPDGNRRPARGGDPPAIRSAGAKSRAAASPTRSRNSPI
jgi:triphosphatase